MTGCRGASRLVRKTSLVLFAALIAALSAAARGETYPDRPIQLVVPAGAGSSTDTMMRSLAQMASPMLAQSIVILNRPGASGIIGVSYANARPYLGKVKAPVLALYPTGSNISTADQEQALREHIDSVRVVHLNSPYALLGMLEPAACAGQILNFAAMHDGIVCHE
jgi:tripartite-type tricarboxylate transporter receptor subunit TctC